DPYKGVYYKDKSSKEAYGGYLLEILRMVEDFKDFDNVGHFEYITRYAGYDDRMLRYREHSEVFDEIFRKLIYSGRGFELNTASFRDKTGIKTIDFDTDILIRYRELGGEIISLGSDAHQPEYLGYKFGYFSELLKQKGYRYVARYESRKPVFEKL
ncbi:MAG: histidinol phosphate phosphatase, partial [Clostridiales bacterium]|nr:histidinol phosphate phosphatase [Clostridiales bacterium]